QGLLTGRCGLMPIQRWYFSREQDDVSYYNQRVLMGVDKNIKGEVLEDAVKMLLRRHDGLRFVYHRGDEGWEQEYGTYMGRLDQEDLRNAAAGELDQAIGRRADSYQRSLDIGKGELVRVVWMRTPDWEQDDRLLIVIHHLAVDGVSWRILLEDLEELLAKGAAEPGRKTSSYREWRERLVAYGSSRRVQQQRKYWEEVLGSYRALEVEWSDGAREVRIEDMGSYRVRLDKEQTRRLLQELPRVYHTEINDVLLAALAQTICDWQSREKITIGLEGHGREEGLFEGVDVSRTVGWFTSLYPVALEVERGLAAGELLKAIKEQLRRIPDKGIGYGVLGYEQTAWDIRFNYLGQLDNATRNNRWLRDVGGPAGESMSGRTRVGEKLLISAAVEGGELVLEYRYSGLHYGEETMRKLGEAYKKNLGAIIGHCGQQDREVYTPSDYGLGGEVSYKELDRFLSDKATRITGLYRLSGLQEGMLFHGLYDGKGGAYLEQFSCELKGVDEAVFAGSWSILLRRHSVLRSAFYYDAFRLPVQCVYGEVQLPLTVLDYRELGEAEQAAAVRAYEELDHEKGFDFREPPLLRVGLLRLSDERYRMVWTHHHILFDGWSRQILVEEFLAAYELLSSGGILPGSEDDRYEDYIRYIEQRDKTLEEEYWRGCLEEVTTGTLLPFIRSGADRNKGDGQYKEEMLVLDQEVAESIGAYAQRLKVTVNTVMQGAWAYLVHRYTGNREIIYGVTVAGRPEDLAGMERRVGLYINTLPLCSRLEEGQETGAWLMAMQEGQLRSREYQYTPLSEIQRWTGIRGELFDSLLVFENYPVSKVVSARSWRLEVGDLQIRQQTNYPLTLTVSIGEEIGIGFTYNTGLLTLAEVRRIQAHFGHVLRQIIASAQLKIGDIALVTPAERQQLLSGFNNTVVAYAGEKTVVDLFRQQAVRTPEKVAVVFGAEMLTYGELEGRSNQLARYLRELGVEEGGLVPICVERSLEMVIGILGILKAGGAYVPLDPAYPADRLQYMLEDTAARVIVSSRACRGLLPEKDGLVVVRPDEQQEEISRRSGEVILLNRKKGHLTYVIYTSGSTGRPKGVSMPEEGLVNLLLWHEESQGHRADKRVLQFASINFDASFQELFSALCFGGRVYLIDEQSRKDAGELLKAMIAYGIHHLFIPYVVLKNISEHAREMELYPGELEAIFTAGEQLRLSEDIRVLCDRTGAKLFNYYGPSEAHVVTAYEVRASDYGTRILPPIGKPIGNTSIYILDQRQDLCAVGVVGEICIGGVQVASGYLHRPELTAEKFVANPYGKGRIYRTGDLGRWLEDGEIEFLGRRDHQVKVRGNRVELGEVESVLGQCPGVRQCVVLDREDIHGYKLLVGYVVAEGTFSRENIWWYMRSRLPDYMIPSVLIGLDSLPLTINGKVDKKALPQVDGDGLRKGQYVAPRTESEQALTEIWAELLGIERIGIDDNFFELGGHSLLATRVVSAMRRLLGLEVAIRDLFIYPTIGELSAHLGAPVRGQVLPVIVAGQRPDRIPLSYSQERLWFIDQLEGGVQYHMPSVLRLRGALNVEAL
ncbi:MAG TPA: amino acid adenylation domain-containing protein, partial [Puia sp.]|nr:amino acid adenylation domain-containing protein [Puia sp.]